MHARLKPYYSEIGRPSIDPELMIRMLIIGYCYGLRSERRLTQEVDLHLAYRWFCRLDLDDEVPHHSTFSENRLHRFRESDVFRHLFERIVTACVAAGLVKGEGFAVDARRPARVQRSVQMSAALRPVMSWSTRMMRRSMPGRTGNFAKRSAEPAAQAGTSAREA